MFLCALQQECIRPLDHGTRLLIYVALLYALYKLPLACSNLHLHPINEICRRVDILSRSTFTLQIILVLHKNLSYYNFIPSQCLVSYPQDIPLMIIVITQFFTCFQNSKKVCKSCNNDFSISTPNSQ